MRTYKVVLCDREEGYIVSLMNYMNRNTQIPVLAMAFTDANEMYAYLTEHKVDLIYTECIPGEISGTVNRTSRIIYIYSTQEQKPEKADGIFKYSPASEYVRNMLQVLSEEEQVVQSVAQGSSIAVYSPHGRSGKTMLAKALCAYYSRQNRQISGCIYLGMEEYGYQTQSEHAVEEFLYYIKQRTGNISMKLKSLAVDDHGYDLIAGNYSYEELRELSEEDIKWLVTTLRQEGMYEKIVVDIGSGSLMDLKLLQYFNVVYLPRLRDGVSEQKWKAFCSVLRNKDLEEGTYRRWYPVYINATGISDQEVRRLELRREQGELDPLYEELIRNVPEDI